MDQDSIDGAFRSSMLSSSCSLKAVSKKRVSNGSPEFALRNSTDSGFEKQPPVSGRVVLRLLRRRLDFIDREQRHPLLALRIVRSDLWVERLRNPVERDAVVRLDDELLLEPELLLEVLELCEEVDDLSGDAAGSP